MKKVVSIIIAIGCIMSLTGCASMLKSMGGVSKADLTAYTIATDEKLNAMSAAWINAENAMKEVDQIKALVAQLTADLEEAKLSVQELQAAKATVDALLVKVDALSAAADALSARVNTLSDETLLKLAKLIQDALAASATASAATTAK
ncbi:MAG TPA: hypothetical protein VN445_10670 [Rectinemataceae bacterium]|nr:hypothetical protein [Rectinemataceae bacterium]